MQSAPHSDIASLPDRAQRLRCSGPMAALATGSDFAGEYEHEVIREVASKSLGVSMDELVYLTHHSHRSPDASWAPEDLDPGLFAVVLDGTKTPSQQFLLRLTTKFCAIVLASVCDKLRETCDRCGISWKAVCPYFFASVAAEHERISLETVLFESNLALKNGFVERGDVSDIKANIQALWSDRDYLRYLDEKYPLLRQHLGERTLLLASSLERFVCRLAADLPTIKSQARIGAMANVFRLSGSLGDSHNGGARVAIVEFSGGFKVVYKPRSVSGEASFQRYLKWINQKTPTEEFCTLWVIERENYGWMEFVAAEELASHNEAAAYFHRYGGLIAIVDSIAGTDIHYENLVAVGQQPVVIDLETIIQPLEFSRDQEESKRFLMNLDYFVKTPLFTGMFDPAFLDRTLNGSPLSEITLDAATTVDLDLNAEGYIVLNKVPLVEESAHLPRYAGAVVNFFDYIEAIVGGYRELATLIARHRRELLNEQLEAIFGDVTVRVIFRLTVHYANYVDALYSPFAMRSIRNSEDVLSKLWRAAVYSPVSAPTVLSEYRDLWNGDIPFFTAKLHDTGVRGHDGSLMDGVFKASGMAALRERYLRMGFSAIEDNIQVLDYCLRQKANDLKLRSSVGASNEEVTSSRTWQGLSALIGDRLLVNGHQVLYMDTVMGRDLTTSQGLLGDDLYTGLPGVLLALAYSERHAQDQAHREKLYTLAEIAFLRSDQYPSEIGVCKGIGGLIYLAAHLGALWSDPHYWEIGAHLAKHVAKVLYTDRHFDVFSGAAGALLAIDALFNASRDTDLLSIIDGITAHLLTYARHEGGQVTWLSSIPSRGATSGFAHGVSGIAYALLRAHRIFPSKALEDAIIEAERFIHQCFLSSTQTWSECMGDTASQTMEVWCHGAAGIALFYDELAGQFPSEEYRARAELSRRKTIHFAKFENDSICHGTLGNIDLLISRQNRNSSVSETEQSEVHAIFDSIREELQTRDLFCGNERRHVSLSLFNGLAGCAYQLLRMDHGASVPSVATFEGPYRYGR